ncbi:hypothetical protein ACFWA4_05060 [Streptomyces sp. NPDC060011]|uniref:hypothetical protein n=1 Tax=Streptomyces sp. NPDC060011 TaxID=3347037 RepID=UPI003687394C
MKITIDTARLAEATQWALRAVPQAPPAPVLAGLRIEARDGTLTLSGFDYYRSAGAREDCDIETPDVVLVGGRGFTDLARGAEATTIPPPRPRPVRQLGSLLRPSSSPYAPSRSDAAARPRSRDAWDRA